MNAAKKTFLLLVALATLLANDGYAQDTLRVSLADAVSRALEISPEMDVEDSKVYSAQSLHSFAKANRFLSQINLSSVHSLAPGLSESSFPENNWYLDPDLRYDWSNLSPFNQLRVDIAQPLYTWGQIDGSINATEQGIEVAKADSDSKKSEVVKRIASNYMDLLLALELKRLADETGQVLEQAESKIEELLDGDDSVDDADLFQAQLVRQEYNAQVVEVGESLKLAKSGLRKQMFIDDDQELLPAENNLEAFDLELRLLEDYQKQAQGNRPEIKKASAALEARNQLVKVAKSDYFPKLFLGVSGRAGFASGHYKQRNPFISDPFIGSGVEAGLGLRMNLNFAQTKAKVARAQADQMEVLALQVAGSQLVDFEVENAYRKCLIARAAKDAQNESVRISGEWLRTEQINFDLELGNMDNLVKALQANLKLRADYFSKVRAYNLALIDLLEASGTLVDEVALLK